jgi:hypothetical protein
VELADEVDGNACYKFASREPLRSPFLSVVAMLARGSEVVRRFEMQANKCDRALGALVGNLRASFQVSVHVCLHPCNIHVLLASLLAFLHPCLHPCTSCKEARKTLPCSHPCILACMLARMQATRLVV